jgi:hypothetical protein
MKSVVRSLIVGMFFLLVPGWGQQIQTIAGQGKTDGAVAATKRFEYSSLRFAYDSTGTFYVAYRQQIYTLDNTGRLRLYAGVGQNCQNPNLPGPTPKVEICFEDIVGLAGSLTGGSLYVRTNRHVYEIQSSGNAVLIAGGGSNEISDNAVATSVYLDYQYGDSSSSQPSFEVSPITGELHFFNNRYLVKVSSGRIRFVAGNGQCCEVVAGPALNSALGEYQFSFDSAGRIVFITQSNLWNIADGQLGLVAPPGSNVSGSHLFARPEGYYYSSNYQLNRRNTDGTTETLGGSYSYPLISTGPVNTLNWDSVSGAKPSPNGGIAALFRGSYPAVSVSNPSLTTFSPLVGTSRGTAGEGDAGQFASFGGVYDLVRAADGTLYVSTEGQVRKISTSGIVTTLAGNLPGVIQTSYGCSAEGVSPLVTNFYARALAVNANGVVYWSCFSYEGIEGVRIQRVDGQVVRTVAGGGQTAAPFTGQAARTVRLLDVSAVTTDRQNRLLVADGDYLHRIAVDGTITTIAGTGVGANSGDGGQATSAAIGRVNRIAVQADDSIYIAVNAGSQFCQIRKISPTGIISTIAGLSSTSSSPSEAPDNSDPKQVLIGSVFGLAVDNSGKVFFTERRSAIRYIENGVLKTLARANNPGFDDGPAFGPRVLSSPFALALGDSGSLHFLDNNRVRQYLPTGSGTTGPANTVTVNIGISGADLSRVDVQLDQQYTQIPQSFSWVAGEEHRLEIPSRFQSPFNGSPVPTISRFVNWSGGFANPFTYTVPSTNSTLTANFATYHRTEFVSSPANAGSFATAPALQSLFYYYPAVKHAPAGNMNLSAVAANGFRFVGWSGMASGTNASTSVNIDRPGRIVARFEPTGSDTTAPFGSFDSPRPPNNVNLSGQFGVTGWALDNRQVSRVIIERDAISGDPAGAINSNNRVYIGDATLTCKARPDIVAAYPTAVNNDCAGWGYALLSYGLPNQGNGTFTLHATAVDWANNRTLLGYQQITVNNNGRDQPFGTIDTPFAGQTLDSERTFTVSGWALATPGKTIDPTKIKLVLDGQEHPNPVTYGTGRPDVGAAFPGFLNAANSGFNVVMPIFNLEEGAVKQVAMVATDSGGRTDGLGSRPWIVGPPNPPSGLVGGGKDAPKLPVKSTEKKSVAARGFRTGWQFDDELMALPTREAIAIPSMGRAEIHAGVALKTVRMVGSASDELPSGASVDLETGSFYWHALPAFMGEYEFELVPEVGDAIRVKIQVGALVQSRSQE